MHTYMCVVTESLHTVVVCVGVVQHQAYALCGGTVDVHAVLCV